MVSEKIHLNKRQIEFIVRMTEIRDPMEAVKKMASIMNEERADVSKMGEYIDRMIQKLKGK
jgi:hypothetical protein